MKTTGRTILITGAGTGIGLGAVELFDALGSTVITVARDGDRLIRVAALLQHAHPYACDIADPAQVDALVEHVRDQYPPSTSCSSTPVSTTPTRCSVTTTRWRTPLRRWTSTTSPPSGSPRSSSRCCASRPTPRWIITTSGAALVPDAGRPTHSASKAARHSMCQTLRFVLGRAESPIEGFEVMAPLTDSPFAAEVASDTEVAPIVVAQAILDGLEAEDPEMHVGATGDVHPVFQRSPQEALQLVDSVTGG